MLLYVAHVFSVLAFSSASAHAMSIPHQHLHHLARRDSVSPTPCPIFTPGDILSVSQNNNPDYDRLIFKLTAVKLVAASMTDCMFAGIGASGSTHYGSTPGLALSTQRSNGARFPICTHSEPCLSQGLTAVIIPVVGRQKTIGGWTTMKDLKYKGPTMTTKWQTAMNSEIDTCESKTGILYDIIASVLLDLIKGSNAFLVCGGYNVWPYLEVFNQFFDIRSGFIEIDEDWDFVQLNLDKLDQLKEEGEVKLRKKGSDATFEFYGPRKLATKHCFSGSRLDVNYHSLVISGLKDIMLTEHRFLIVFIAVYQHRNFYDALRKEYTPTCTINAYQNGLEATAEVGDKAQAEEGLPDIYNHLAGQENGAVKKHESVFAHA
ncbi:hypothetical protein FRB93_013523 [Tulasnella sp. JGI-2019a]|nr:hypothetical protein FRB93_013523 [Tulasnella sp. JGI-2019a]